ncbi:MAG: N-acetylmuramoyl-L-alanine amidase [Rivularia sp. (in: cyanobacteria)]
MKFGIDFGHGCPPDTGAVGVRKEEDLIKEVGDILISNLKKLGHEVILCRPAKAGSVSSSLYQRCATANKNNVEIFASLHFNAFNGQAHGCETYAISAAGRKIAAPVQSELSKLGFYDRGVKTAGFYVLKHTAMPAILVEGAFCDSPRDMALFDAQKMADGITKGLAGKLPKDECICH